MKIVTTDIKRFENSINQEQIESEEDLTTKVEQLKKEIVDKTAEIKLNSKKQLI